MQRPTWSTLVDSSVMLQQVSTVIHCKCNLSCIYSIKVFVDQYNLFLHGTALYNNVT